MSRERDTTSIDKHSRTESFQPRLFINDGQPFSRARTHARVQQWANEIALARMVERDWKLILADVYRSTANTDDHAYEPVDPRVGLCASEFPAAVYVPSSVVCPAGSTRWFRNMYRQNQGWQWEMVPHAADPEHDLITTNGWVSVFSRHQVDKSEYHQADYFDAWQAAYRENQGSEQKATHPRPVVDLSVLWVRNCGAKGDCMFLCLAHAVNDWIAFQPWNDTMDRPPLYTFQDIRGWAAEQVTTPIIKELFENEFYMDTQAQLACPEHISLIKFKNMCEQQNLEPEMQVQLMKRIICTPGNTFWGDYWTMKLLLRSPFFASHHIGLMVLIVNAYRESAAMRKRPLEQRVESKRLAMQRPIFVQSLESTDASGNTQSTAFWVMLLMTGNHYQLLGIKMHDLASIHAFVPNVAQLQPACVRRWLDNNR